MVLIMVGILLAFENDTLRKKIVISVFLALGALIVGVIINTVLMTNESTKAFFEIVPYTSTIVKEKKCLGVGEDNFSGVLKYLLPCIVPGLAFSIAVLMLARKNSRKTKKDKNEKDNLYGIHNTVLLCILISIIGAFFLSEDAYCLIGIISPVSVLAVCLTGKPSVVEALEKIERIAKNHIAVSLGCLFAIETVCYILLYHYRSFSRIIDTINYIV